MIADASFSNEKHGELVKGFVRKAFKVTVYVVVAENDRETINVIRCQFLHTVLVNQLNIGGCIRLFQAEILEFLKFFHSHTPFL